VAFALRFRPVLKGRSIIQDGMIVHKLYIPTLEFHHQVRLRIIRQFVQQIKPGDLPVAWSMKKSFNPLKIASSISTVIIFARLFS
jgi:hypothetical protein